MKERQHLIRAEVGIAGKPGATIAMATQGHPTILVVLQYARKTVYSTRDYVISMGRGLRLCSECGWGICAHKHAYARAANLIGQ
jgi:hypothetical protein